MALSRRYALYVFDLDGTLVDSLADIAGALNQELAAHGRAPLDQEVVRTLVGDGVLALAERALEVAPVSPVRPEPGDAGLDPQTLAAGIQRRYLESVCVASTLYPGISETLTALRGAGAHLAVLTNKLGNVARPLLEVLGIAQQFDAIIGDGDGHPRKPAPGALHALCARFGVPVSRTLMVGDGLPDVAVARAAGCDSAAALWGYTPADRLQAEGASFLVDRPEGLLSIGRAAG